jgi:hypothetical protein
MLMSEIGSIGLSASSCSVASITVARSRLYSSGMILKMWDIHEEEEQPTLLDGLEGVC